MINFYENHQLYSLLYIVNIIFLPTKEHGVLILPGDWKG